jgi:eukaryotic-like serine/threonine-protein kinase
MKCPICGTDYPADAKFCTRDGTRLGAQAAPLSSAPPAPVAPPKPAAPPPPATPAEPVRRNTNPSRRPDSPAGGTPAGQPAPQVNLAGQTLEGRYKIVKKVGEGGMSFVYLATDVATNHRYAIKVLSSALSHDDTAMARLKREASLGMRLEHPNICHIIRLGETEDGLVYVVMPFVEGEILSDRNQRLGVLPVDMTVNLVRDIAEGLHFAHQLRIVHRDLKPENIMVTKNGDGSERAVVMDFGLAKERRVGAEIQKLTSTGTILGTPEFMSPEQLRGKPLDPRTDVYSLALMTYEMLTSKLPFIGRTQQETMIARLRSDPIPLRQMKPELNLAEGLEKAITKALSRDPDGRYPTSLEFATALEGAMKPAAGKPEGGGLMGRLFGR